jgi:hypothetical protein
MSGLGAAYLCQSRLRGGKAPYLGAVSIVMVHADKVHAELFSPGTYDAQDPCTPPRRIASGPRR